MYKKGLTKPFSYVIMYTENRKGTDNMWYIVSKNGLRGIETYTSESSAWFAADMRNRLINQGWHPVRVA